MMYELSNILVYGLALTPVLIGLIAFSIWQRYRSWWTRYPSWQEATRHGHRLHMGIERVIRFRWIHQDCKYWVFPVRLDRGPITVRGIPNQCLYWSLTYYCFTEVNPSISSPSIKLSDSGDYEIRLAHDAQGSNQIPIPRGRKYGVLYLRIYEPTQLYPTHLPEVSQNGVLLTGAYDV